MRWKTEEEALLHELYPSHSFEEMAIIFRRNTRSIKSKCLRMGLYRYNKTAWSDKDMQFLKENIGTMTYAALSQQLGRSVYAIVTQAANLYREKYTGCDLDCFHCTYSDCLAPMTICKSGYIDQIKGKDQT